MAADVDVLGEDQGNGLPIFNRPDALLAIPRGDGALIVVDVAEHNGWPRLGVRLFVVDPVRGWEPTRTGFSLHPRQVDAFAAAVAQAAAEVKRRDAEIVAARAARAARARADHVTDGGR